MPIWEATLTDMLEIRNLSTGYGKAEVIHSLNLRIPQASIVTVIGPNGAGKSTLLNAIMGLLPAQGEILFKGNSLARRPTEDRLSDGLGLVAERRELFGEMTVEDNLVLGAYVRRFHRDGSRQADLQAVFDQFPRLRERRGQRASTLSGGERQMLAIGRALMSRPSLLMLDEPSLGLAPLIVKEVLMNVARLRTHGVAILIVEQNARAALQIADYGYVLEGGKVALEGEAKALAANSHVIDTYLGRKKAIAG
jgi:branched-chain amino acid transport system ATP-binding protein